MHSDITKAPIAKLEKENGLLIVDSEKFQKILQQYEVRKRKLIDTIAFEEAELASKRTYYSRLSFLLMLTLAHRYASRAAADRTG